MAGSPLILAIVEDPFFKKLIEDTAQEEGESCLVLNRLEELEGGIRKGIPIALIADLSVSSIDIPTLIGRLKLDPVTRGISIIAFGSSIRADLMQDTREVGADLVMKKSSFKQQLPEIIRCYQKKITRSRSRKWELGFTLPI